MSENNFIARPALAVYNNGGGSVPSMVTSGLVGLYDAGDVSSYSGTGSTWYDISGSASVYDGSIQGPVYNSDNQGTFFFDGINDYVNIGTTIDNEFDTTDEITVGAWFKLNSVVSKPAILSVGGAFNFFLPGSRLGPTQQLFWEPNTGWAGGTKTDWALNQFYYLNWTISADNTIKFYVDGQLDFTSTVVSNISSVAGGNLIGQAAVGECASANVGIVEIYNRALNATEINQNFESRRSRYSIAVYNNGETGGGGASDPYWDNVAMLLKFDGNDGDTTSIDSSNYAAPVTFLRNSTYCRISSTESKFGDTSAFFANSASGVDYAEVALQSGININSGEFTIECWVNWSGGSGFDGILTQEPVYTVNGSINLYLRDGKPGFSYGGGQSSVNGNTVLNTGTWYHIAWVREPSSDTVKIYLNGVLEATTIVNGAQTLGGTGDFRVGLFERYQFNGYIDELRVTQGVARYTEDFTPPTEAFPTN